MANSSRPAAPRTAVVDDNATSSLSGHRALMSLSDIRNAIGNVDNSLVEIGGAA